MSATSATLIHDVISNPTEVIKQRLQMYNSPYKSIGECARKVFRQEGLSAFYRSYTTQLVMNLPYQAIHFSTYEFFQETVSWFVCFVSDRWALGRLLAMFLIRCCESVEWNRSKRIVQVSRSIVRRRGKLSDLICADFICEASRAVVRLLESFLTWLVLLVSCRGSFVANRECSQAVSSCLVTFAVTTVLKYSQPTAKPSWTIAVSLANFYFVAEEFMRLDVVALRMVLLLCC